MSKHGKIAAHFDPVAQEQIRNLANSIQELKQRVHALETALARSMALLIANLSAVVASLLQQIWRTL